MSTQLFDTYRCNQCLQKIEIVNTGFGRLTCCSEPMENISHDRIELYLAKMLTKKRTYIQKLEEVKRSLTSIALQHSFVAPIDELINAESEFVGKLARYNKMVGSENSHSLTVLIDIIDDLYLVTLNHYPQFCLLAQNKGESEAKQMFLEAIKNDKDNIKKVEALLYKMEYLKTEDA